MVGCSIASLLLVIFVATLLVITSLFESRSIKAKADGPLVETEARETIKKENLNRREVEERSANSNESRNRSASSNVFLHGEAKRWKEATTEAAAQGYSLAGFYHTSTWKKHYKQVIQEQLLIMDGRRPLNFMKGPTPLTTTERPRKAKIIETGGIPFGTKVWASVLDYADFLLINVAGDNTKHLDKIKSSPIGLDLRHIDKIRFNFNKTVDRDHYKSLNVSRRKELMNTPELSAGEVSTHMLMQDYCTAETQAGRKALVFYVHNKGACCVRPTDEASPEASWREVMNTFNIEFPSICLRALMDGYSACGVELQDGHFSGNFFWARCDHIAALPPLEDKFDAWAVELNVFRVSKSKDVNKMYGNNCGYSAHNCRGVNHYESECYRDTYRSKIMDLVQNRALPLNPVSTAGPSGPPDGQGNSTLTADHRKWVSDICGGQRKRKYEDSAYWDGHESSLPMIKNRESLYTQGKV